MQWFTLAQTSEIKKQRKKGNKLVRIKNTN